MKNGKSIYIIYILIAFIIVLTVLLAKITLSKLPKKTDTSGKVEPLEIKTYPNVNDECTFKQTYLGYGTLINAGCEGGYTRYDMTDINLKEKQINVSVIYSDKKQPKTGVYVEDKRVVPEVYNLTNIKFGIFEDQLFILDKNEPNVLVIDSDGKVIYSLREILKKYKIKDLSEGDINIKGKHIDKESFTFQDGSFEFDAITGKCENDTSKGSHYIVKYKNGKFERPEFVKLIEC